METRALGLLANRPLKETFAIVLVNNNMGGGGGEPGPGTCMQDDLVSVLSFCKGKRARIRCFSLLQQLPGGVCGHLSRAYGDQGYSVLCLWGHSRDQSRRTGL